MADLPFRKNIGHLRQDGGGRSVPSHEDRDDGTVYQRHQNNGRPVRALASGHLLRRETTREGAAEDGRQGKMADKASDPMLRQGFLTHLEETKGHVKRPKKAPRKLRGAFCDGC